MSEDGFALISAPEKIRHGFPFASKSMEANKRKETWKVKETVQFYGFGSTGFHLIRIIMVNTPTGEKKQTKLNGDSEILPRACIAGIANMDRVIHHDDFRLNAKITDNPPNTTNRKSSKTSVMTVRTPSGS